MGHFARSDHLFLLCGLHYNIGMMRKIFKTGHSAAVTLSKSLLKDLGLKVGDSVKIEANKDCIVISHGKQASQLPLNLKLRPHLK